MSLFYYVRFFLFFLGCLIHCHVQFVACTFVTCCNKDQSINQSINRKSSQHTWCHLSFRSELEGQGHGASLSETTNAEYDDHRCITVISLSEALEPLFFFDK